MKEYLNLPFSSAFISVCIPKISMDIDINFLEALKVFDGLYNKDKLDTLGELNEHIHLCLYHSNKIFFNLFSILAAARSLGRFILDMSVDKAEQSLLKCSHSIDLSPVIPWVFFANRPFLFLITYGDYYLLIGQMLGPKLR